MKRLVKRSINKLGIDIVKYKKIVDDSQVYRNHYGHESVSGKRFYNVSAGGHFGFGGNFSHPCWTNIDVDREYSFPPNFSPGLGIVHDPLDLGNLPLDTNSAELFHSRFTIEHITNEAAEKLFKEIYRCLKDGGIFRIVVPNFQLDYEAFMRKDWGYFSWVDNFSRPEMMELMNYSIPMNKASLQQVFLVHFAANASTMHGDGCSNPISDEEVDEIFNRFPYESAMNKCVERCCIEKQKKYRQNHINWWSYDKTEKMLKQAGFRNCFSLTPGQSLSPVMRRSPYFDNLWNDVALFLEAVK